MATQAEVRRIALSLPDVVEAATDFAFSVPVKGKPKGFAWVWKERVVPKKPHYNGFPAVLVRLAKVRVTELRPLLVEAHRCIAKPPR